MLLTSIKRTQNTNVATGFRFLCSGFHDKHRPLRRRKRLSEAPFSRWPAAPTSFRIARPDAKAYEGPSDAPKSHLGIDFSLSIRFKYCQKQARYAITAVLTAFPWTPTRTSRKESRRRTRGISSDGRRTPFHKRCIRTSAPPWRKASRARA